MRNMYVSVGIAIVVLAVIGVLLHLGSGIGAVNDRRMPLVSGGSYTMQDVASRNSAESCWSVIDGHVYDLTDWISQHPGGTRAILGLCGSDGTAAFQRQHGSSGRPAETLAGYRIGSLVD